jgi:twitching motility protein PilT
MVADSLKAVLCQHLIPRRDGTGRVLAAEILLNNDAVANLIRKGKAYQIQSVIATAREQGMQAMDTELRRLVREEVITAEEAYMRAASKKDFEKAGVGA